MSDFLQVAEQEGVFEELNQADYDERQMARRDDDFIVDDEGFGYKDKGGEIWEVNEGAANDAAKKKKRKLNVSQLSKLIIKATHRSPSRNDFFDIFKYFHATI